LLFAIRIFVRNGNGNLQLTISKKKIEETFLTQRGRQDRTTNEEVKHKHKHNIQLLEKGVNDWTPQKQKGLEWDSEPTSVPTNDEYHQKKSRGNTIWKLFLISGRSRYSINQD